MENSPARSGTRQRLAAHGGLLAATALVAVSIACFAAALGGQFIFDDWPLIANNDAVHSLAGWREWLTSDFWNVDLAQAQLGDRLRYFRPLVLASYALDWQLGKGSPLVLHTTNLLLHGLVALLVLVTLRRWTGELRAAFVGALLFSVHPSKAESIAWISGRPDLWLTFGICIASLGMARRVRRESGGWALEALGTALAYASKEHALVLPAFACIETWVALGRPGLDRSMLRRWAISAWPQVLVALVYLGARAWLMPLRQFEITGLSAPVHLGLVLETLGRIYAIAVWPDDLSMMQGMIRTGLDGPRLTLGYVAIGSSVTGLTLAAIVLLRQRRPALALSLGLWLWMLMPVSNLVWSGFPNLTSPRFLYLPLLGLAWCAAEVLRAWPARRELWALGLGLPLLFAGRALVRTLDFRSASAFWNGELTRHPDLAVGYLFAVEHTKRQGRPRQALELSARGFALTARDYSHLGQRSTLLLRAVQLAASLARDAQRSKLVAIDGFITQLLGTEPAALRLDDMSLEVPEGTILRRQIAPHHLELLLVQADIATRLGDDQRGLALAERAVTACPRCAPEWESAALIALRAGDATRARLWLAGPRAQRWTELPAHLRQLAETSAALDAQIAGAAGARRAQLEFRRHSLLGLTGRAYAALAPHESDILREPAGRVALAEAAARAGADADARRLLGALPPDEVERLISRWTAAHSDAPLQASDDLEFEATLARL